MGATEFVRRLLGKPVMVDGADYCYEDEWSEVPQADFRPVMAEANARVLSMPTESLAELDADLLTEDAAAEEDEDEAAWQAALAAARSESLQATQASAAAAARPVVSSPAPAARLPKQSPARRSAARASLSDPLARAAGLAHAKAPAAAPVRLSPAKAETAPSRAHRPAAALAPVAASAPEAAVAHAPRRRREPTQQMVSRPTAVLTGPEVRRVDDSVAASAAPAAAPAARAPAVSLTAPSLLGRRPALTTPLGTRPAPMASKPAMATSKPALASKPAMASKPPMATKPALASKPAMASKPIMPSKPIGKLASSAAVVTEREEDWDAVIARAKRNTPEATPVTPAFQDTGDDDWARAMELARNGGSGPINAELDWDAALRAAKARSC